MKNHKYKLLNECLSALSNNVLNLLILQGSPGLGKSYTTIDKLKKNNVSFAYTNTYSTPLAMYRFLYENSMKDIIIFDDVHGISDPVIKSILKAACGEQHDGRRFVSWNSTSSILEKEELPDRFEVLSGIILISNDKLPGFEPLISRGVNIKFNFSFSEKIEIFESLCEAKKIDPEIIEYVKFNCSESTKNLSIRTLVMLSRLKEEGYDYKLIASEIFEKDGDMEDLLKLNATQWCDKTGKHRATYYRRRKNYNLE